MSHAPTRIEHDLWATGGPRRRLLRIHTLAALENFRITGTRSRSTRSWSRARRVKQAAALANNALGLLPTTRPMR